MAAEFHPVATRRTFEEAVEQIADRIALGDLHVGDQLPPERVLAGQMQISRPTLREALRTLADAGVVEIRPGSTGGAFVAADVVPRDILRRERELRMGEVAGVLEARRLLEPQVAILAARRATREDFAFMERTIELQAAIVGHAGVLADEDRFLALDRRFHLAIARATGNTTVVGLMRTLLRRLEIARDMALHEPPVAEWALDVHRRTLAAIRDGDPDAIERIMDEHLAALERSVSAADVGKVD